MKEIPCAIRLITIINEQQTTTFVLDRGSGVLVEYLYPTRIAHARASQDMVVCTDKTQLHVREWCFTHSKPTLEDKEVMDL